MVNIIVPKAGKNPAAVNTPKQQAAETPADKPITIIF